MRKKMDSSQSGREVDPDEAKVKIFDTCQTPPYALQPLLPYLWHIRRVWEPCCGQGWLVKGLRAEGIETYGTDMLDGEDFKPLDELKEVCRGGVNFLTDTLDAGSYQAIVTNPPYSVKQSFIQRCYDLGKPFALLMPIETLGTQGAQKLFEEKGLELIVIDKRIDFCMPNMGWGGKGAHFGCAWYTWGLNIGSPLTFGKILVKDNPLQTTLDITAPA